ncbi:MAG: hypothetical protein ACRDIU_03910 [Actinomycetota bacterium]
MKIAPLVIVLVVAALAGYLVRRWLLIRQLSSIDSTGGREGAKAVPPTGGAETTPPPPAATRDAPSAMLPSGSGERRSEPDPQALAQAEASRVGFDLEKLRHLTSDYQPVEEFLRYIQVQRGEGESSLIFVRARDLDSMGALLGMSKEGFVDEFEKLGVMISPN